MHIAEITTDQPVTIVEIELKHPPNANTSLTGPLDPVTADPAHYHVEFENDQVRVVRVKIGPGETTKLHRHSADRIVTYLTDQDFQIAPEGGSPEHLLHKAGDASWGTAVTHQEKNLGATPFEAIVTELK